MLSGFAGPQWVEFDVEGVEDRVILGANEILREFSPMLVPELQSAARDQIVFDLEARGYLLPDADEIGGAYKPATNILGMPPALRDTYPTLLSDWNREFASWTGSSW